MSKNYAYNPLDKTLDKLNNKEFLRLLFESTKDNYLAMPRQPYYTNINEIGKRYANYVVTWEEEDFNETVIVIDELINNIKDLSKYYPQIGFSKKENEKILPPHLLSLWSKYIADYDDGLFEQEIERTIDQLIRNNSLPLLKQRKKRRLEDYPYPIGEEIFTYWKHINSLKLAIKNKLGDSKYAFDLLIRIKRLYYLYSFEANNKLIKEAQRLLIQAYVLYKYCHYDGCGYSEFVFDIYNGYGFPLINLKSSIVKDILLGDILWENSPKQMDLYDAISYYKDTENKGNEILEEFNAYDISHFDDSMEYVARHINKKFDINLDGFSSFFTGENNYLLYLDDNEKKIDQKELIKKLEEVAKYLNIDRKYIKHYEIKG